MGLTKWWQSFLLVTRHVFAEKSSLGSPKPSAETLSAPLPVTAGGLSRTTMRLSNAGCEYITGEEGIRLKAYQDQIGVWTIGVGHTGPEVKEGLAWSIEKVMEVFRQDVKRFESCISENVKTELSQCQFDALVSFSFNVGCGNFRSSTMLRLLNEGKISEAAEQFPRWNKAAGKVLPVLVRRREREKKLFLEGRYA